jgi:hypothetical protein
MFLKVALRQLAVVPSISLQLLNAFLEAHLTDDDAVVQSIQNTGILGALFHLLLVTTMYINFGSFSSFSFLIGSAHYGSDCASIAMCHSVCTENEEIDIAFLFLSLAPT